MTIRLRARNRGGVFHRNHQGLPCMWGGGAFPSAPQARLTGPARLRQGHAPLGSGTNVSLPATDSTVLRRPQPVSHPCPPGRPGRMPERAKCADPPLPGVAAEADPPGAAASRGSPPDAAVRVGRFLAEFGAMCAVMWPHSGS
jgi:hypothetical protein